MSVGFGRYSLTALAALTLAVAAGCGEDEDEGGGGGAKPKTASIEITEAGKNRFRFTVPASVPAGVVRLDFKNSTKQAQEAQIVGIDGNHTIEEALKEVINNDEEGAPIPPWLHGAGGVGHTEPGQSSSATQTLGKEGRRYYVVSSENEGENAPSPSERGAVAELKVQGTAAAAELPPAPARITAKDYTFEVSGLKPGKNTIEFDNSGRELHHALALPFAKGATFAEVKKALTAEREPKGPPPVDFRNAAGTAVIDGGTKQVTTVDLKKGKYALVCFITDRKGGPPHVAKGMVTETEIR